MTPERRTEVVRRIMLTVVKARSIAAENGYLDIAEMFDPRNYGTEPLSLLTVAEAMLADGRTPAPLDVVNILTLANLGDTAPAFAAMYGVHWGEDLPDAMEALT